MSLLSVDKLLPSSILFLVGLGILSLGFTNKDTSLAGSIFDFAIESFFGILSYVTKPLFGVSINPQGAFLIVLVIGIISLFSFLVR